MPAVWFCANRLCCRLLLQQGILMVVFSVSVTMGTFEVK